MGEQHALGDTSCAGREHDIGNSIAGQGRDGDFARCGLKRHGIERDTPPPRHIEPVAKQDGRPSHRNDIV